VLIINGAQQALDLIGRVLVEPGDVVAVEEPGCPPARQSFRSQGATVVARLVYTAPSHQFPMGAPWSLARRRALLPWADRHDSAIVGPAALTGLILGYGVPGRLVLGGLIAVAAPATVPVSENMQRILCRKVSAWSIVVT
jgi:hypothetical protein